MEGHLQYESASCRLTLGRDPNIYWLTSLRTDPRYQSRGYAHQLLEICKLIAKRDGKVLRLWVGKFDEGLSQDELFKFYGRHGFVKYDENRPTHMEWRP